jgi:hypothetical protein
MARMDFTVFEDARNERTGTAGAVLIVLSASIVAGIGTVIWASQHDYDGLDPAPIFLKAAIAGGLLQTAFWAFFWVYMSQWVLLRLGAKVVYPELIRTMGVAFVPMYLSLLVGIKPLAVPFGVFSLGLCFLYSNVAIEQTADVTAREATFANIVGFGAFLLFMGVLANVAEAGTFGGLAPGILFFSLDL